MIEPNSLYIECGVLLEGLAPDGEGQTLFFAVADTKGRALTTRIEGIFVAR